jgi:hypothetical protein
VTVADFAPCVSTRHVCLSVIENFSGAPSGPCAANSRMFFAWFWTL